MPNDLLMKAMNTAHRTLLTLSGGRLGWSAASMPVLQLTTKGRKSGQERTVMLTSPLQEGDTYVIVASKGGDEHHPAWFLNLRDDPNVQVSIKGAERQPMTARIANPDERARMWPVVASKYKGYAGYQEKTEREIPLVLLTPN